MNNIMIFQNRRVEVLELNGQALFNPYDCGNCLDLSASATRNHLATMRSKQAILLKNSDVQEKDFRKLNNAGEKFLTESGVFKLIFKSNKEEAEKFQDWVTDEVLPSIRKTGGYIPIDENMSDSEIMARALQISQKTIQQKDEKIVQLQDQIEKDKTKVIFANAVSASHTSILVGELAKILKQNGVEIGQNKFFQYLREQGYLIKRKGTDYNMPTQRSMEQGLFEIKETSVSHSDGHISVNKTPKVTGKGQQYFINKFLENAS